MFDHGTHQDDSEHRFLSHNRKSLGVGAVLDGKNNELRAATDADGYCIEYRETKQQHVQRIGLVMRENKGVSWTQIGLGKAFELAALGIQAAKGDVKREKPSFINIPGTIIYNN